MTSARRNTIALAVGSAVSGVLAYLVFALTTRALGPTAAAPVSVLWSYWAFAGAAFTFPLQHWVARTATAQGEGSVHAALPRIAAVMAVASVLLGVAAWVLRGDLFAGSAGFPVMVAMVTVGSALIGVVRGGLSARHRFVSVAWSLVTENGIRFVGVFVLLVTGVHSAAAYGLCLVAGHLAAFLWPSALRYGRERSGDGGSNPLAFLAGAGVGQLIAQTALTGGPVLLALTGGAQSQVTTLFAAMALFRAPYMLALGMVAQLTARLSHLAVSGQTAALSRMRNVVLGGTVVLVVVAAAGAAWLGPEVLRLVFGDDVVLGPGQAAIVAAGCTLAVSSLVLAIGSLARNRAPSVARAWVAAVAVGAVGFVLMSGHDPLDRTVWTFLVIEAAALSALVLVDARASASSRQA
jgi:O-antigen/teichoic acid export membrane protein